MTIYSHSRLSCYEQCPQKYKFQYIDKIKIEAKENIELFLGRRVHKTLKKLYQDLMYQKEDTLGYLLGFLRDEWATNWNNSITIVKEEHDPDDYLEMTEKCITGYYNQYKPFNQGRTMGLEERIFLLIWMISSSGVILIGLLRRKTAVMRFMIIRHVQGYHL